MKRIYFSLLLTLLLLAQILCAHSENVDLSALSNDELMQLSADIQAELANREINTDELIFAGIYSVGLDIKPGKYLFTAVTSKSGTVSFIVFETKEKYDQYFTAKRFTNGEESRAIEENAFTRQYLYPGQQASISLSDDMVVMIKNGACAVEAQSKPSWAP